MVKKKINKKKFVFSRAVLAEHLDDLYQRIFDIDTHATSPDEVSELLNDIGNELSDLHSQIQEKF